MADKKGVLDANQEREIAKMLDDKIKFDNKLLETFDGKVFKAIISIVDDYGLDKLNEKYKDQLDILADYLFVKDWENAVIIVWELASMIIKEHLQNKDS